VNGNVCGKPTEPFKGHYTLHDNNDKATSNQIKSVHENDLVEKIEAAQHYSEVEWVLLGVVIITVLTCFYLGREDSLLHCGVSMDVG